jgi:hypothetical protein
MAKTAAGVRGAYGCDRNRVKSKKGNGFENSHPPRDLSLQPIAHFK